MSLSVLIDNTEYQYSTINLMSTGTQTSEIYTEGKEKDKPLLLLLVLHSYSHSALHEHDHK